MSLDYPVYEKIKDRNRWLGMLWRLGDTSYYVGLVGAVFAHPYGSLKARLNGDDQPAVVVLRVFLTCALIFVSGVLIKSYVHRKARRTWPDIYNHNPDVK